MEGVQFVIFFIGVFGLFIWNRAEARADARKADENNTQLRRDLIEVTRSIDKEMKDFHARLSVMEERYLQIISKR